MTCVLSMTPLYVNPCSGYVEDGNDLQNKSCENFDFNWINSPNSHTGLSESHRCSTPCRIEACTGTSISCRVEISNSLPGTVKHESLSVHCGSGYEAVDRTQNLEKPASTNGEVRVGNLFEMCQDADPSLTGSAGQGIKRKADVAEFDEVYVPSKRVSPFLNTPKERKDERKKILKISIKKLKQLDDPEAFLRRTVLVNNTMKRLQTELREEKLRSKKFESSKKKSFNGYRVLNNSCLSNSYLFDDPFLSGVHEKITDDMTETLMNNVFHDKPGDRTEESDNEGDRTEEPDSEGERTEELDSEGVQSEQLTGPETVDKSSDCLPLSDHGNPSNSELCDMDVCDTDPQVDSSLVTSLNVVCDSSNQNSNLRNTCVSVACTGSSHHTCLQCRTNTQEMSVDRCVWGTCDELVRAGRCNINNNNENSKSICQTNCEAMHCGKYRKECIHNSSEVKSSYSDQNLECDKLHSTNLDFEKSTDVQINHTDTVQKRLQTDKDNSFVTSKSAINGLENVTESSYGLDLLDLDQKLDQKSLSHSFNTFLSAFDISHTIPISLSYKES